MKIFGDGVLLLGGCFFFGLNAIAKDQEFRFEKPDAQSVALMCECNSWKAQPMTKQSDGTWTTTVSISLGSYGYKFLVNGTDWVFDPKNPNRRTVNGIENFAIEITDGGSEIGVFAGHTGVRFR